MSYTFVTTLDLSFDESIAKVTAALAARGFGVLTTIDIKTTLKKKIDADFRPYTILGACSPSFAHQALLAEEHIGVMLPCNVIVQEKDGVVEVAAVDPIASMTAVENPALGGIAMQVQQLLRDVIESL